MFARDLADGTVLMIEQEDHTDLAAQFAAHWGNDRFARLDPYRSMVFATIYHDSGHREMEADLPIDVERGVPYAIGRTPPGVRKNEADAVNAQWIRTRDPYASLIVTMHHAGLRKRRYDTVRGSSNGHPAEPDGTPSLGMDDAFTDLTGWQREVADRLELSDSSARAAFWHNYRMLQVFDLLSLYFCRDGFDRGTMREVTLERVPVRPGSDDLAELQIVPTGPDSLRIMPYPLDVPELSVSMMTRVLTPVPDKPEEAAKEAYYQARRTPMTWRITR
jgi:hypothetical protein